MVSEDMIYTSSLTPASLRPGRFLGAYGHRQGEWPWILGWGIKFWGIRWRSNPPPKLRSVDKTIMGEKTRVVKAPPISGSRKIGEYRRAVQAVLGSKFTQTKGDIMDFKLVVKPAIPPEIRHKIEKVLQAEGFNFHGGGTDTDLSSCDITFSGKSPWEKKD